MSKKILIIKTNCTKSEADEIAAIISIAEFYKFEVIKAIVENETELESVFDSNPNCDYVYISSHGDSSCITNDSGLKVDWPDFSTYDVSFKFKPEGQAVREFTKSVTAPEFRVAYKGMNVKVHYSSRKPEVNKLLFTD
jgi:hypothetical protein